MRCEMSKGERMRTHTERTESDHLSARNSSVKGKKQKDTHCVANLERFARFITQRVMNFSPRLKRMQKTRELEFGTHCVPNLEKTLPIKFYTDERITEFDQGETELAAVLKRGILKEAYE